MTSSSGILFEMSFIISLWRPKIWETKTQKFQWNFSLFFGNQVVFSVECHRLYCTRHTAHSLSIGLLCIEQCSEIGLEQRVNKAINLQMFILWIGLFAASCNISFRSWSSVAMYIEVHIVYNKQTNTSYGIRSDSWFFIGLESFSCCIWFWLLSPMSSFFFFFFEI